MTAPKQGGERALSGGLDRFYTGQATAAACVEWLKARIPSNVQWVEPSAGAGAFLDQPGPWAGAFDIEPGRLDVRQRNWFDVGRDEVPRQPWALVGNPPFGPASANAIRFMKHGLALGASWVAFILPPPWRRAPALDRAPAFLHHIDTLELPECQYFTPDGPVLHRRVFVLWEQRRFTRPRLVCPDVGVKWTTMRHADSTHCIRVAGGGAGQFLLLGGAHNPAAVRYLHIPFAIDEAALSARLQEIAAWSTVQTYITKHEVMTAIGELK